MSTSDLLKHAERVFFEVVALPEGQRASAVDRLCAGNVALRTEVESLLRHSTTVGEFLASPALGVNLGDAEPAPAPDPMLGRALGNYVVRRRLAAGGMGVVYLADRAEADFKQEVAIKVVKRGMDTEEILRRFRAERRTLASLNHPNIARLLDGGATDDGQPYLVMEYVQGQPIDEYCDQKRLGLHERLRLFRQVCDAVQYAHQNLTVHRDLKPGNILVTGSGVPKLLDFGISKVLSAPGTATMTSLDERRLTPEYASPEQVKGDAVTTATDIYSLGVILYELLAGRRPYTFVARSPAELERLICIQAPQSPSTSVMRPQGSAPPPEQIGRARDLPPAALRRHLRGDLDNIILKALRKEPERRYASAEQFASDIDRYLNNLPVSARQETPMYVLAKFVRRHRVATGATALVAAVILGAAAAVGWQARVASLERDEAYAARDQAEAIVSFLQRMLSYADPQNEGPDARVRSVLDTAAENADTELHADPRVKAAISSTIGSTYLSLGLYDVAEKHIRAAFTARESLLGMARTDQARAAAEHDLAESKMDLAHLHYARAQFDEAESLLRESLETHERLRGPDEPANADISRVLNDLGAVLRGAGKLDEAESVHRRALEIRIKIGGADSIEVAESLNNLANVLRAKNDLESASRFMAEALRIRRVALRAGHPLTVQAIQNMAVLKASTGDYAGAIPLFEEAVELEMRTFGPDHPSRARTLVNLANVRRAGGDAPGSEAPLREALRIQKLRLDAQDPTTWATQSSLARTLNETGRDDQAVPLLEEAVAALAGAGPRGARHLESAATLLAEIYDALGRAADAARIRAAHLAPRADGG
jgi:serine/threonine protein kinase